MENPLTSGTAGSTREALRVAVQDLHDAAEAEWADPSGFASVDRYLAFLGALQRAHLVLGLPAAQALPDPEYVAHEEDRIRALHHDLGTVPDPAGAGPVQSPAYAWGVSYALQGSSVGAAIMLKHGAIRPGWPDRYMQLGRDHVRSGDLNRFFDRLDAAAPPMNAATEGASDVFRILLGTYAAAPVAAASG